MLVSNADLNSILAGLPGEDKKLGRTVADLKLSIFARARLFFPSASISQANVL